MVDPQTKFLLNTVGLLIEILGAWSVYASIPRRESNEYPEPEILYKQTQRGYFNLGLLLTLGLLLQYIAGL